MIYLSTYSTSTKLSLLQALGPFTAHTSGGIVQSPYLMQHQQSGKDIVTPYSGHWSTVPVDIVDWGDSSIETMLASEEVLARDWNTPEEDEAWANL